LILAAVAVLVGGFVLASGSDDDGEPTAPVTTANTTAPPVATTPATTTTAATTPAPPPAPTIKTIRISGGKPVGGVADLEFDKGERVRFRVRSDVAEEVHVHGYDIAKDVAAGGSVTFSFDADIDGKFEVELEHSAVQIASLTVAP
jgi:hypothetical protein